MGLDGKWLAVACSFFSSSGNSIFSRHTIWAIPRSLEWRTPTKLDLFGVGFYQALITMGILGNSVRCWAMEYAFPGKRMYLEWFSEGRGTRLDASVACALKFHIVYIYTGGFSRK